MDKLTLNKEIVSMRHIVSKAKAHTISKLLRSSKQLKNKKGSEKEKEKNQKKAAKFLEEIKVLKKLKDDKISKYALINKKASNDILADPNASSQKKVLARLLCHPSLASHVNKFHENFPTWDDDLRKLLPNLGAKRRHKKKKKGTTSTNKRSLIANNTVVKNSISGKSENEISSDDEDSILTSNSKMLHPDKSRIEISPHKESPLLKLVRKWEQGSSNDGVKNLSKKVESKISPHKESPLLKLQSKREQKSSIDGVKDLSKNNSTNPLVGLKNFSETLSKNENNKETVNVNENIVDEENFPDEISSDEEDSGLTFNSKMPCPDESKMKISSDEEDSGLTFISKMPLDESKIKISSVKESPLLKLERKRGKKSNSVKDLSKNNSTNPLAEIKNFSETLSKNEHKETLNVNKNTVDGENFPDESEIEISSDEEDSGLPFISEMPHPNKSKMRIYSPLVKLQRKWEQESSKINSTPIAEIKKFSEILSKNENNDSDSNINEDSSNDSNDDSDELDGNKNDVKEKHKDYGQDGGNNILNSKSDALHTKSIDPFFVNEDGKTGYRSSVWMDIESDEEPDSEEELNRKSLNYEERYLQLIDDEERSKELKRKRSEWLSRHRDGHGAVNEDDKWRRKQVLKPTNSNAGNSSYADHHQERQNNPLQQRHSGTKVPLHNEKEIQNKGTRKLHPSWEAKRKLKEQQHAISAFQGKKIKFDD